MINFVYNISNFNLFFLISSFSIVCSIIGFLIVVRFMPFAARYKENQVSGYLSATICMIYAILFGFVALYILNNFDVAEQSVQQEANFLADIYHDSKVLAPSLCAKIQAATKGYIYEILQKEWPSMLQGHEINSKGDSIIDEMTSLIYNHDPVKNMEFFAQQEVLKGIKSLYGARAKRIFMGRSALGVDFWVVIILGAFLTIAVNFIFGMEFYLHLVSIIAIALAVSSIIFLIIAIDRPFRGEFAVKPDGFQSLLALMDKELQKGSCRN